MTTALATENEYVSTIIEAARFFGWHTAHFRAAKTNHGWRTAVQGDGKGFVDLVLCHPGGRRLWFVEVKRTSAPLTADQKQWGEALLLAGAVYRVIRVPDELEQFLQDLADAARPT